MSSDAPPFDDYRNAFEGAVRRYWTVRAQQAKKQSDAGRLDAGTRGEVTGGAHLDAMAELVEQLFVDAGIAPEKIRRRGRLNLPGYHRPSKRRPSAPRPTCGPPTAQGSWATRSPGSPT